MALAFPDALDLGLGNLGLQILYAILNARPWCRAERVFAPMPDAARLMRQAGIPLFSLESRASLASFDGIGFSLQTELAYTNLLGMLDLSGIPLRFEDRRSRDPLVFAGGPGALNPAPLWDFMDFLVLGDGEEVVVEIAEILADFRSIGRTRTLEALDRVEGVLVPALRRLERSPRGWWVPEAGSPTASRRVLRDLDAMPGLAAPLLPGTDLVHDRLGIEIQRGCTRGCRFCHAGYTTRPVRERSPERILEMLDAGLASTGWEEAGLLSLSSMDHSRIEPIVLGAARVAASRDAGLSIPSLRLDGVSIDLARRLTTTRRSGLTFAPEAATPRMRACINKWISDERLLEVLAEAAGKGWEHVKLYFMIGLPTEGDEDVLAIADLARRALAAARSRNRRFTLNLGVNTFIPKPWTPFQWEPQIHPDEAKRRHALLLGALASAPAIRVGRLSRDENLLEGVLARADREASTLLEAAFKLGCSFDAWGEHRRMDLWRSAIEVSGFDVARALGERPLDEPLPWEVADVGVDRSFLLSERARAREGVLTPDCRQEGCQSCGMDAVPERRCHPGPAPGRELGEDASDASTASASPGLRMERRARLVLRISRTGRARFLSNQETMSAWSRALRRVGAPLSHTQGFHAHPRVAFSAAFPVGEETVGDYMDVELAEDWRPLQLVEGLAPRLPEGLGILAWTTWTREPPSLMSQVLGARYRLLLPGGDEEAARLGERIAGILGGASLPFERRTGKSRGLLELRPSLQRMEIVGREGRDIVVHLETHRREGVLARPRDLLELLGHEASGAIVRKLDVLVEAMDRGDAAAEALQLVPLSERWPFPWERAVEPV